MDPITTHKLSRLSLKYVLNTGDIHDEQETYNAILEIVDMGKQCMELTNKNIGHRFSRNNLISLHYSPHEPYHTLSKKIHEMLKEFVDMCKIISTCSQEVDKMYVNIAETYEEFRKKISIKYSIVNNNILNEIFSLLEIKYDNHNSTDVWDYLKSMSKSIEDSYGGYKKNHSIFLKEFVEFNTKIKKYMFDWEDKPKTKLDKIDKRLLNPEVDIIINVYLVYNANYAKNLVLNTISTLLKIIDEFETFQNNRTVIDEHNIRCQHIMNFSKILIGRYHGSPDKIHLGLDDKYTKLIIKIEETLKDIKIYQHVSKKIFDEYEEYLKNWDDCVSLRKLLCDNNYYGKCTNYSIINKVCELLNLQYCYNKQADDWNGIGSFHDAQNYKKQLLDKINKYKNDSNVYHEKIRIEEERKRKEEEHRIAREIEIRKRKELEEKHRIAREIEIKNKKESEELEEAKRIYRINKLVKKLEDSDEQKIKNEQKDIEKLLQKIKDDKNKKIIEEIHKKLEYLEKLYKNE